MISSFSLGVEAMEKQIVKQTVKEVEQTLNEATDSIIRNFNKTQKLLRILKTQTEN